MGNWLEEVEDNVTIHNYIKVVVGLKSDDPEPKVTYREASEFASLHGAHYYETSAKEGTNVNEMF